MSEKEVVLWEGRRLSELTHEELITVADKAVLMVLDLHKRLLSTHNMYRTMQLNAMNINARTLLEKVDE